MIPQHIRRARRPASAVDTIVDSFRTMVGTGALRVGDDLPTEREMADQFGVSRNTFREAIKRLEAYGIVETHQKRGARIVNKSVEAMMSILSFRLDAEEKTFQDVQQFRTILERGLMPEVIARASTEDLDDLTAINERLNQTTAVGALAEIDLAFHQRLLAVSGNDTALKVYDVMSGVILQIMTLGKAENGSALTYRSHKAIVAAITDRNADALDARLTEHMGLGLRYLANRQHR